MDAAYRHCDDLVRTHDKDRFLSSLFAPADRRRYLHALYAFDIEIARIRDLVANPCPAKCGCNGGVTSWRLVVMRRRRPSGRRRA